MGRQPPVNVRGVGERHNIVRQTDSGFGVDTRVNPGGPLRPIPPLPLSGPLPHDLCHGWDSPYWLPAKYVWGYVREEKTEWISNWQRAYTFQVHYLLVVKSAV